MVKQALRKAFARTAPGLWPGAVRGGGNKCQNENPDYLIFLLTLYAQCASIYRLKKYRGVEQLVARRAHNPEVVGSNPSPATTKVLKLQDFRTFSALIELKSSAHFRQNRADPNRDPDADISG